MKSLNELKRDWLNEEKERRLGGEGKRAKRRYLHFDNKLDLSDLRRSNVWVPSVVLRHSFFPFIRYTVESKRYKKTSSSLKKTVSLKKRDIDYGAHFDSLIFSWYAFLLTEYHDKKIKKEGIEKNITAYRKDLGENNVNFAKRVFDFISAKRECTVLCLDVSKFFPSLDHQLLKESWIYMIDAEKLPEDHFRIFRVITQFAYVLMEKVSKKLNLKKNHQQGKLCDFLEFRSKVVPLIRVNKKKKGIPQGSPISAILSNIYMFQFDKVMSKYVDEVGGLYQRYCDDIILVLPQESLSEVEHFVLEEVKRIKLNINPSKVEKRKFIEVEGKLSCLDYDTGKKVNLQYLGIGFDGERTYIRHSGIGKYEKKMMLTIRKAQRLLRRGKRTAFPTKKIYGKFYHSTSSNFISYAKRAGGVLNSPSIKKQLSPYKVMKKIKKFKAKG